MNQNHNRSSERGVGAIDLLLALTLAGLVLAATVPGAVSTLRTYHSNGAARQILGEIRAAQSLAVTRGSVFGLQWGAAPGVNLSENQYRIVRDDTGSCGFPAVGAPPDDTSVIRGWISLSSAYSGMTIQSILDNNDQALGGVMFNSMGTSVNTCLSVSFPVTVTVSDPTGTTRLIEIASAGSVRLL